MGLFDWVICHMPLPGIEDPTIRNWQTKSMDCQMQTYRIKVCGQLLVKAPDAGWDYSRMTGEIRFYDGDDEFSSYFVDGKLKELHRIQRPS